MHAQRCPWLLRADRRGSVCRGGLGSAHGYKSLWCARHCGRAIPGWCVCLPLAPVGGWPYLAIGQRGGATTSFGRCGSSPALPSQRPPRPGDPLFEPSSNRGGGAPVAHGLPQSRRQIAGMQAATWCHHHGLLPLHAGPHQPVEVPGIHPTITAPAAHAATGSGAGPRPPQSGIARHLGSPGAATPGCLAPREWRSRWRWPGRRPHWPRLRQKGFRLLLCRPPILSMAAIFVPFLVPCPLK